MAQQWWTTMRRVFTGALAAALLAGASAARAVEYEAYVLAAEQATPRACFTFTASLGRPEPGALDPFVRIEPAGDVALAARERDLCVSGLRHGDDYRVTFRAGLPAADGTTLAGDVTVALRVPDRQPRVAFRSKGHVLPLQGDGGIPLSSVNVGRADLRVYRVGERNLMAAIGDGQLGTQLDTWSRDRLADQYGLQIFAGAVEIDAAPNQDVTTALPFAELVGSLQPGLYVVVAEPAGAAAEDWQARATQWFTVSDLGVTAFSSDEGLLAVVRSLATAAPVAGARLTLMARNNEALATLETDATGQVRFPAGLLRGRGGNAARLLLAAGAGGDFTFLDLASAQLDLADRGLDGRTPPGALDAFVWTERGIYRPGETVQVAALLRDDQARAVAGLPLSARLIRPDAVEVERLVLRTDQAGGGSLSIPMPPDAFSGQWTLRVVAGDGEAAIGEASFLVEDFVPPRLEVAVAPRGTAAGGGAPVEAGIRADWLYGAPAAGLDGEAEMVVEADPAPFPALPGYAFGLVQEPFLSQRSSPAAFKTDDGGAATVALALDEAVDTTQPLRASLRARVFDVDGRPVETEATVPYAGAPWFVGIRPQAGTSLPENTAAAFDIAAVEPDGRPHAAARLGWELVRETVDYVWFERYGQWDYQTVVTDDRLDAGEVVLDAAGRAALSVPVESGRYRIELFDPASGVASSLRFTAGWWASAETGDRPDLVEVRLEPASGGQPPRAFVKPPYPARILLALADTAIRKAVELEVPAEGRFVDLADWSVGVGGGYLLATAFAATGVANPRLPSRAVGAAWLPGPKADRTLDVAIEAPASMEPGHPLDAVVRVDGPAAFVTLAAVDDAILRLTDYAAPDAADYYLGKRRLGLEIRDLYGRLIDPAGRRGRIVSGGDMRRKLQLSGSDLKGRRSVAFMTGPVAVAADGTARFRFDIPDFNGRLRLMAVAWNGADVGQAEATLTVRPPLVADLTMPRFLAPGDRAQLRLRLTNLAAPAGDYTVALATRGPLAVDKAAATLPSIGQGATGEVPVVLSAGTAPGDGAVEIAVSGPDGFTTRRTVELTVRPDQPFVTTRQVATLEPGQSLTVDAALGTGFLPGTARVSAQVGALPAFDPASLAADLRRYPYACPEQIVSRAQVAVVADTLALPADAAGTDAAALQAALRRLASLQNARGGFGGWSALGGDDLWLTAYATDFVLEARASGVPVAAAPLDRALDWLAAAFVRADSSPTSLAGAAYAAEVLARAGRMDLSNLRYFAGRSGDALPTDLARAQLAAAFATLGDRAQASRFAAAIGAGRATGEAAPADFGTPLRDEAGVIAVAAPAGLLPPEQLGQLAGRVAAGLAASPWQSTQEQAWALRAAAALRASAGPVAVSVDGVRGDGVDVTVERSLAPGMPPVVLRNEGTAPVYRSVAVTGIPAEPSPAESRGFTLSRQLLGRDGRPAALDAVRQNDQLVVLIEGQATADGPYRALVVDLLPAGFELENVRLSGTPAQADLAWLGDLSFPANAELRADRFVAALDLMGEKPSFRLAYIVRAVTPGAFRLPGSQVEDMYRPELRARTAAGSVTVAAR